MKKKIISAIITILIIIAYFVFKGFTGKIEAPTIEMDGVKIELGTTKVKEILDKGLTIEDSKVFEPLKTVPGKQYTRIGGAFVKDKKSYASFGVANTSSVQKNVEDCTVFYLTFYYSNDHYYQDTIINGFNPKGLTLQQIKEKLGEPFRSEDNRLVYRSKNESCDTRYEFGKNGLLDKIEIEIDKNSLK